MSERVLRIALPVLVLALVLGAWQAIVDINRIPPYVLPAPGLVFATLISDSALLMHSLWVTLLTTFDRRELLPRIEIPTLVLAGADDRTAPASVMQRMAEKIPGSEYLVLDGCGHLGPMDQPDAFNQALEGFLARHMH